MKLYGTPEGVPFHGSILKPDLSLKTGSISENQIYL